jgi:hypothetical protein
MTKLNLHAFVARGKNKGELLLPHKHEDGMFVVSLTRFEKDYKRIRESEILGYLEKGLSLRMSNPKKGIQAASLVTPESIFRPVKL